VSTTAGATDDQLALAGRFGLRAGDLVQQLGYATDCDQALLDSIAALTGQEVLDDQADEVVDVVLLWWRDGDGDLVDALMDALSPLTEGGAVWLLTPKSGRAGHVEASEVNDAAPTAGLSCTKTLSVGKDWSATRLVAPKSARR
jgi:hypothetical protein